MPIQVEIVSPEKILVSKSVDMAVVPSVEGDLAAMAEHAPMIVLLRGGLVSLYEGDTVTDQFYVGGGFAEITGDRCTVLADEAIPPGDIDRADADSRLAAALDDWNRLGADDVDAAADATYRLQVAQGRVDAAGETAGVTRGSDVTRDAPRR